MIQNPQTSWKATGNGVGTGILPALPYSYWEEEKAVVEGQRCDSISTIVGTERPESCSLCLGTPFCGLTAWTLRARGLPCSFRITSKRKRQQRDKREGPDHRESIQCINPGIARPRRCAATERRYDDCLSLTKGEEHFTSALSCL